MGMKQYLFCFLMFCLVLIPASVKADNRSDPREQAVSDVLDAWREGRYEHLYDRLSRRTGMTREQFVEQMKDTQVKPSCCFQKLQNFRVINENPRTSKVFASIGMDGVQTSSNTRSREFTLDYEDGGWKMRLGDIKALAELRKKKHSSRYTKKYYH